MTRKSNRIPRLVDLRVGATARVLATITRFEACHVGVKADRTQDHFEKIYRDWRRTWEIYTDPDPVRAATKMALKYIRQIQKVGGGRCCPKCP